MYDNPSAEDRKAQQEIIAIANSATGDDFAHEESRGVRNPVTGRFRTHKDNGGDDDLNVRFFTVAEKDPAATYRAGGVLKFRDVEYITIEVPGQPELRIETQVDGRHKFRFPNEYANFKRGMEAAITGTPLALWASLSPAQIAEMNHAGIRTVEQLANLSENAKGAVQSFYQMKERAQQFLAEAKDMASAGAIRAEMEQEKARLEAKHAADMRAQEDRLMALMEARIASLEKPKKAAKGDVSTD